MLPAGGINSEISQGARGFARILPNRYLLGLFDDDPNNTRNENTYFRLNFFYKTSPKPGAQISLYRRRETPTSNRPYNSKVANDYRFIPHSSFKFLQEDDGPNLY